MMKRTTTILFILAVLVLLPMTAWASDGLLVLVTEETADETGVEQAYWWSGAEPQWSATDLALRDAFAATGAGFAEPSDLSALSKIYRRPAPSDANAAAMATVFGRSRVLVGTVRYVPTELRPVGLVGWRAEVSVRVLERGERGAELRRTVELRRARWAPSDDEARAALRAEVAESLARAVAAGLERNAGPVGVNSDELLIGVAGPSTRAALNALRAKLATFAGVNAVVERWAAEGLIVFEVNPGVADPRASVQQYVSLLTTEGAGTFGVRPGQSTWPNVAVIHLEEGAP